MHAKNIVWLASFPKSGNTWLRIFLANYLFNRDTPIPINEVRKLGVSDALPSFYRAVANGAFDPNDPEETVRLRGKLLARISSNGAHINFVKTHNARIEAFGVELIPDEVTRSAIYIVRSPFDVAVSYARHFGMTLDAAVDCMGRFNNTSVSDTGAVKQFFCSWSAHVASWTGSTAFPLLVLRYEDMLAEPRLAFTRALEHLGVPVEADRLDRAMRFSSFDELHRQEEQEAFIEASRKSDRFFHTGTSGQWREAMPESLVGKIRSDHGEAMRALGYLDQ